MSSYRGFTHARRGFYELRAESSRRLKTILYEKLNFEVTYG